MKNSNNIVTKVKRNDFIKSVEGLESFLNDSGLDLIIESGGFIAGGFVRHILKTKEVNSSYFGSTRYNPDAGDVDIFFRSKKDFERSLKYIKHKTMPSKGGFAKDVTLESKAIGTVGTDPRWDFYNHDNNIKKFYFRTQLVDCLFGTPEEVLSDFDIVNCMVGFDDEYFYVVNEEQRNAAELSNLILLNGDKNHNSFLASRIKKYTERYGYTGISQESIPVFKTFLVELLCDSDNLVNLNSRLPVRSVNTQLHVPNQKNLIKKLIQEMPEEELVMFIGKVQITTNAGYGKIVIKDACIEEFNRRSGGQCD